jgi:hypothetical protein
VAEDRAKFSDNFIVLNFRERYVKPDAPNRFDGFIYGLWHPRQGWLCVGSAIRSLRVRWSMHPQLSGARIGSIA